MNKRIQKIEISEDSNPIAIKVYCYEELSDTSKEAFIKAFGVVYAKELWGANVDSNTEFIIVDMVPDFETYIVGGFDLGRDVSKCAEIKLDGNYRERNFEAHED